MAKDNYLEIILKASVDKLKSGLDEAGKALDNFEGKAKETNKETEKLGGSDDVINSIDDVAAALKKAGGSAGVAGEKLSGLSSLLQKASPFFSTFAVAGGAAVVALTVLGGALAIAGIAMYEHRKELKETLLGITDITEAFDVAAASIGKQIGRLTQLTDAYADANTSEEDKLKIMGALQKEFPAYFKDLADEGTALETVQTAYENQKKAIVGLGIAKALEAKKAPIYAKIAELYLKKELSYYDKFKIALKSASAGAPGLASLVDVFDGSNTVSDFTADLAELDDAIKTIDQDYDLKVLDKLGLNKKDPKPKGDPRDRVAALTGLPTADAFFKYSATSKEAFNNIIDSFAENIDGFNGLTTEIKPLPPLIDIDAITAEEAAYLTHLENVKQSLINFNEAASQIISANISNTFAEIGAGIGQALAEGGNVLNAAGGALLAGVGNIMVELGKLAIATGVGLLAIKLGLESLNPVVAIAAGIALVALGTFVGAKASSIGGGIGSGGGSSRGVGGSSQPRSYGSSGSSSGGGGGGTYVFEIQGTKLVGVLSNTLKRNGALGGNLQITSS